MRQVCVRQGHVLLVYMPARGSMLTTQPVGRHDGTNPRSPAPASYPTEVQPASQPRSAAQRSTAPVPGGSAAAGALPPAASAARPSPRCGTTCGAPSAPTAGRRRRGEKREHTQGWLKCSTHSEAGSHHRPTRPPKHPPNLPTQPHTLPSTHTHTHTHTLA